MRLLAARILPAMEEYRPIAEQLRSLIANEYRPNTSAMAFLIGAVVFGVAGVSIWVLRNLVQYEKAQPSSMDPIGYIVLGFFAGMVFHWFTQRCVVRALKRQAYERIAANSALAWLAGFSAEDKAARSASGCLNWKQLRRRPAPDTKLIRDLRFLIMDYSSICRLYFRVEPWSKSVLLAQRWMKIISVVFIVLGIGGVAGCVLSPFEPELMGTSEVFYVFATICLTAGLGSSLSGRYLRIAQSQAVAEAIEGILIS